MVVMSNCLWNSYIYNHRPGMLSALSEKPLFTVDSIQWKDTKPVKELRTRDCVLSPKQDVCVNCPLPPWLRDRPRWRGGKYLRCSMGRDAAEGCFLDVTWLSLIDYSSSRHLHKVKPSRAGVDGLRVHPTEELLAVGICWGREKHPLPFFF